MNAKLALIRRLGLNKFKRLKEGGNPGQEVKGQLFLVLYILQEVIYTQGGSVGTSCGCYVMYPCS